jgi:predicted O-methyltransferase YrrM
MTMLRTEYEARAGQWSDIQGHLPTLHGEVASRPGARVLELGVRWGTSTSALLAGAEESGGHVWSVDIAAPSVPDWWAGTGLWTLTVGDDLDPAVAAAQPAELDVLFIDSSHTFDQTAGELRLYVPRVRPGGVVLMHDVELDGPDRSYIRPGGTDVPFPVARALDEFCAETSREWEARTGSYGLGIIRVPAP